MGTVMHLAEDPPAEAIFDALGNPMRRTIVRMLGSGPLAVGQIAEQLPISRPAVSKHLVLLENVGLVEHIQDGNRNIFQLQPQGFQQASSWLESFWKLALSRFALVAENLEEEP